MASSINLADIQEAVEKKVGNYTVFLSADQSETAVFKPALRQPKSIRRKLAEAVDIEARVKAAMEDESLDDDVFDIFRECFELTAVSKSDFTRLKKAVGDDPAVWSRLFSDYQEATMTGEASPSES